MASVPVLIALQIFMRRINPCQPCYVIMEAAPGFEPGVKLLQSLALPLGYAAVKQTVCQPPPRRLAPDVISILCALRSQCLGALDSEKFNTNMCLYPYDLRIQMYGLRKKLRVLDEDV